jgi:N-acetylmuramic acid 6-phosphate (MurNAc-6-P) etherase
MYKERIVNIETGEEILQDYNAQQLAELEATQAEAAQKQAEAESKQAARSAVLTKLGLTAEEAQALFG